MTACRKNGGAGWKIEAQALFYMRRP